MVNPYESSAPVESEEIVQAELVVDRSAWAKKVQTIMLWSVAGGTYILVSVIFQYGFLFPPELLIIAAIAIAYAYRWVGKYR